MKVKELAAELNTTSNTVLQTLKSLKLKSKDSEQDLNVAVVSVLKRAFKTQDIPTIPDEAEPKKKAVKKPTKKATKKTAKKTTKKKTKESQGFEKVSDQDDQGKTKKPTKKKKTASKRVAQDKEPTAKADGQKTDQKKLEEAETKVIKKKVKEKKKASSSKSAEKGKRTVNITNEPVITLKPLARKKKRMTESKGTSTKTPSEAQPKTAHKGAKAATTEATDHDEKKEADRAAVRSQAELTIEEKQAEAQNENLPSLEINVPITVKDLSVKLQQKPSVLLKHLMKMGIFAHINQSLDSGIVSKICNDFGFKLAKILTQEEQLVEQHKQEEDDQESLASRYPVVTLMGHVDHGKTSLLDKIRKSDVADGEHGGITQHMGAYLVKSPRGRITFLDTPGHEAFTAMRARGAHITDVVVLVIAADEGIKPQTIEAIDHARAANVSLVVALNKIDKRNADVDRVKKQLSEHDLMPEDWGGKTIVCGVSATSGEGIDHLLEMILLESEMLELKANPDKKASGIVVEAHLSQGKGAVTTLIVQSGTLKEGDIIIVGPYYGKVRAMFNDLQNNIKEAGPSVPLEFLGLSDVPDAGEMFYVVDDEKQAKEISFRRQEQLKDARLKDKQKITLEDFYSQFQEGSVRELNVILKSDVQGSVEALKDSLQKIPSEKAKIKFIHVGVGDVNVSDVLLAAASNAIIIAFHVGIGSKAQERLDIDPVDVREYRIIYDAVNDIKNALEGLLEAKIKKHFLSRIEVRQVFKLSKQGIVAGCYVLKGKVRRKVNVDVVRNGDVVCSSKITSLKRFKDDVKEVSEGMECGITIDKFDKFQVGDILEAYELEQIAQKL
jgi:translation initiation factor IF-2